MRLRRSFVCALGACAVAACSEQQLPPPPAPSIDWASLDRRPAMDAGTGPTSSELAAAQAYTTALGAGSFAGMAARLDDDARFAFPGFDDAHGRDAILRMHEQLLGAFDQREVTPGRIWRTAREQTVEWTMRGFHARDWLGSAATQKTAVIRGVALLWTKDDGSITDVHLYFNVAAVRGQLGLGPDGAPLAAKREASTRGDAGAPRDNVGPGAEPPPSTEAFDQQNSGDEKDEVALYRSSLDALEQNDEARYLGSMADDVEIVVPGGVRHWRGKAELRGYYHAMHAAIGQLDTTATDSWGVGPYAVVEYTIAGVQLGPLEGAPAQRDKTVRLHVVDIAEVRGGKIQRVWRYDDPAELYPHPRG
jgi:steroid delta-isomerase-like uncharacterized protein